MWEWNEEFYRDDRLYFLDLIEVDKGDGKPWSLITRKNIDRSTPVRVDSFKTRTEAVRYIKKIEPATPRISLNGTSPSPVPSYEGYCAWLDGNNWPSALQLHEESRDLKRNIVIDVVSQTVLQDELKKTEWRDSP